MRIKKITQQHRRDFWAIYECPFCGAVTGEEAGYDDKNFHENVIPAMKCKICGKSEKDGDANYRPLTTKYAEYEQV
jgi:transcription elongation factor Elf1